MGFGWQEIDKTLDLGYIRVAVLHCECKPRVLFDPPNFRPHTMTHTCINAYMQSCRVCIQAYMYIHMCECVHSCRHIYILLIQ